MGKVTYSTGYENSKINTYMNLLKYFHFDAKRAFIDYAFFKNLVNVIEKHLKKRVSDCSILEIGCGQRFPITLLLNTIGAKIIGIDADYIDPNFSFKKLVNIFKHNGFERLIKTLIRHIFYDKAYYKNISRQFGKTLIFKNIDIRLMDVCSLNFTSNIFDCIFSNAVFEHLYDVNKACEEISRVIKNGGLIYISIDLFPSLSGGHNLEWTYLDNIHNNKVPPWDHLRNNLYPSHVFLNKFSERDYLEIFKKYFTILDISYDYEGEDYLTEEILEELHNFSKDDLLKRNIKVIMQKSNNI